MARIQPFLIVQAIGRGLALLAFLIVIPGAASAQDNSSAPTSETAAEGNVAAAPLTQKELANLTAFTRLYTVARWFHPSDAALRADWDALAVDAVPQVIAADSPEALAQTLREVFAPLVEGLEISTQPLPAFQPRAASDPRWQWLHFGFKGTNQSVYGRYRNRLVSLGAGPIFAEELAGGIHVRFPQTAQINGNETPEMEAQTSYAGKPDGWVPTGNDRSTRIAATIIAWGVFDQFFPYWDVLEVDWDARLTEHLQLAATAEDDLAFHDVLRRMTHSLDDGHAGVGYRGSPLGTVPISLEWVVGHFVVTSAPEGSGVAVGDIVSGVDGQRAQDRFNHLNSYRVSGSEGWRRMRVMEIMMLGPPDSPAVLDIVRADGSEATVEIERVSYSYQTRPQAKRPEAITEVEPGLLYVDLTRLNDAELVAAADRLAQARGLVFDLRGRPLGTNFLLSHLTDKPILSPDFERAIHQLPDQAERTYSSNPWRIQPHAPRLTRNTVFLMDERAASYPESWLGTIKGNGLATLVGRNSAGANGDITVFSVPGGYSLVFTGLHVRNLDGSVSHGIGIVPDVLVSVTIKGIREGRDEILDAGLAVVREGIER